MIRTALRLASAGLALVALPALADAVATPATDAPVTIAVSAAVLTYLTKTIYELVMQRREKAESASKHGVIEADAVAQRLIVDRELLARFGEIARAEVVAAQHDLREAMVSTERRHQETLQEIAAACSAIAATAQALAAQGDSTRRDIQQLHIATLQGLAHIETKLQGRQP